MAFPLDILVMGQYLLTVMSSGFNAIYFFRYQSDTPRRRIAAKVLSLASLATFVQSLYVSLFFMIVGSDPLERAMVDARHWIFIGFLAMLASLAITGLILRKLTSSSQIHQRRGDRE